MDFSYILHLLVPIAHAQEAASSASPVAVLGLNAKLFIGQLVNFAIVLLVLWKFVFNPVAKKLQERTDKIEKAMNDADRIGKEKEEFEKWRGEEMSKTRLEASSIITAAQTEAGKNKQQILEETRQEQQKLVDQARAQIETDKNRIMSGAKAELADMVTQASEKIIRKKLDSKADQELIKESLAQVK